MVGTCRCRDRSFQYIPVFFLIPLNAGKSDAPSLVIYSVHRRYLITGRPSPLSRVATIGIWKPSGNWRRSSNSMASSRRGWLTQPIKTNGRPTLRNGSRPRGQPVVQSVISAPASSIAGSRMGGMIRSRLGSYPSPSTPPPFDLPSARRAVMC